MPDLVLRGRSPETSRLSTALTRATADGRGSTLLIAGEPGIGKTALLRVLQEQALARRFAVGFGKADEVNQIAPGAAVLQALRTGTNPVLDEHELRTLADLYDRPLWLVEAIADMLELRSQQVPLVIAVDDLQWADRLSRFALRTLTGRLAQSPIVWSIAARGRPQDVFADFESTGHFEGATVEVLNLQPLSDENVLALAADVLGAEPDRPVRDWLGKTGGNPFLAIQVAEGVALERRGGRAGRDLPSSLSTTIRSRTRALSTGARSALQLCAVWGRPLDVLDAARMLGIDAVSLSDSLSPAAGLGLLTESDDPIEFRHDLVRELVYDSLSVAERARLHAVCATYLVDIGHSAVDAAPHARLAAGRGDPAAVQILRRAALECLDSMPQTAAELVREAFAGVSQQDPEWFSLGAQCAEVLIQAQHGADAVQVIDLLLPRTDDDDQRARLQVLAARALWLTGSAEDIVRRITAELSTSTVGGALQARLAASRSLALSRTGTGEEASAAARAALDLGRRFHDRETQVLALQALGEVAKNEGRHLRAYAVFHQLRTGHGPGFLADEIASLQFIDRFADAQVLLSRVSRGGDQRSTAELPSLVCAQLWQDFKLGHFDAAVADAQTLLDIGYELGNVVHRLDARVVLSTVAVLHGDLDRARDIVALAAQELGTTDAVQAPGLTLARARIAAADGDLDAGVRLLKPLMATDSTLRTYWPRLLDQMRLSAGIAVAAGDREFAEETVERAASAARRNPGVASFAGVALQVRGFVRDDLASLDRAVELLRASPRPVMLAAALTDQGSLLLRQGHRALATRQLTEAWEIFDSVRAVPAGEQVQRLLTAAGSGGPRRRRASRPIAGWGSLTGTEVLVARLVGGGNTNRSTAESLGISTNTVAAHLRSIFVKMDVHSRVQLVNAMPAAEVS